MSAVAYPPAKHGAEAFPRMLRVPQQDPLFFGLKQGDGGMERWWDINKKILVSAGSERDLR